MINILERYIARNVIVATSFATLIITGVLTLMKLLAELKNIGEGDYSLTQAIFFVLLHLPNDIYQFSPMLILLGSIIGLSILSTHKELAVMRAAGFSVQRIIYCVLLAAFSLIIAFTLLGEWLGPSLSYKAFLQKENAQNAGQAVITASGVWLHIDDNFIHVERVVNRELLEGVTRYQFADNHRLKTAYFAKTLAFKNNQWQLKDVVQTSFYHDRTKSQTFLQIPWNLKFNTNLLNMGLVEPSEMSLPRLAKFTAYLQRNGLQASEYEFDFWQRIFQPLASLIMIFLALPFVLSTLSTSTMGWRILMGIMVGFVFFILNAILSEVCIVYQMPALFAASLPLGIFACIGILLSKNLLKR